MSSRLRIIEPGKAYHIYNRAVEKRTIFFTTRQYNFFLNRLIRYQEKYRVKIIAYVILPNHFHLLAIEPPPGGGISNMIRDLCNSYAQHFNRTNERSGHVWQGRFNSKLVKNKKYFGDLVNYIYYNPIKHGLVKDVDDWPYLFIATPWG